MNNSNCHCEEKPNNRAIEEAMERRGNLQQIRRSDMSLDMFWEGISGKEFYPEVFTDGLPGPGPLVLDLDECHCSMPVSLPPRAVPCVPCKNKG